MLNTTRGTLVADRVEVARGPIRRGLGLMGRRGWTESDGLLLEHCNSVHTCLMRMSIDVAYVDRKGRVLRTAELRPWRIGPIVRGSAQVLELPAGALERSGTRAGDDLEILP